jgi:hypothetical protein
MLIKVQQEIVDRSHLCRAFLCHDDSVQNGEYNRQLLGLSWHLT